MYCIADEIAVGESLTQYSR